MKPLVIAPEAATPEPIAFETETTEPIHVVPEISPAKLAANRAHAHVSSAPRPQPAKASLNAVKIRSHWAHRRTFQRRRPSLYLQHVQCYEDHFQPVGPEESALVRSLADTQWRLNRIPGLEMGIYAVGHAELAETGAFSDRDESLRPALMEVQTLLTYEKQLRNLQSQEARPVRRRERKMPNCAACSRNAKPKKPVTWKPPPSSIA